MLLSAAGGCLQAVMRSTMDSTQLPHCIFSGKQSIFLWLHTVPQKGFQFLTISVFLGQAFLVNIFMLRPAVSYNRTQSQQWILYQVHKPRIVVRTHSTNSLGTTSFRVWHCQLINWSGSLFLFSYFGLCLAWWDIRWWRGRIRSVWISSSFCFVLYSWVFLFIEPFNKLAIILM